ncbi:MAG: tetratricopeptide repeat protein [Bacteroidales bacterium]|nr:tetratricopeptide repeat protein [Bacteroidales bacterium]
MNILQLFNPNNQSEQEITNNFIIRLKEFARISKTIKADEMKYAPQHFIIQGVRGSGKTTFLLKIYYELKNDKTLNKWLIPIIFNEEQYSLNSLFKFWEQIAMELESESDAFCGLIDKMQETDEVDNYEEHCYEILSVALTKNKNKICVLIDNIGDILKKLSRKEHQRLREVLSTNNQIRIVGASSEVLEFSFKYDEPFYEYFKIIHLKELNSKETREFLLNLDKLNNTNKIQGIIDETPGKIESLRIITGGVPRTIVLMYEIFINDINGDSFNYLELLLDRVTPLYKHRMDDLSTQQQDIVNHIALNWDAISVKEVARLTRMESKAVSAQLRLLEKNNIVIKKTTSTKNHLYQVKERFFNIWYIMRNGRKSDKNKVKWLTRFLELWCDKDLLHDMVNTHISKLRSGKVYDKYAYSMSEAYSGLVSSPEKQQELLSETKTYLESVKSNLANELSEPDVEYLTNKIIPLLKNKENEEAIQILQKKKSNTGIFEFSLAVIYQSEFKEFKKAEKYYLVAVEKGYAEAMNNLASLYQSEFKEFKKAEKYYQLAVEKSDAEAMNNLALLYEAEFKDFKKAEKYYLMAIEKDHADAMNNLALLYKSEFKEIKKAVKYFLLAIEKEYVDAMFNLAALYETEFKDFKKAQKYYLLAVEKGDVDAMNNLALLYETEFKDLKKAEKYLLIAIENGDTAAMNNLAFLYFEHGLHKEKSEQLSMQAYTLDSYSIYNRLTYSLILLWNNKIDKAIEILTALFNDKIKISGYTFHMQFLINLFIAKEQYNFVYKLFEEDKHNLKDRFKPVYYALMHFMQDKYPDEIKKMGEELNETVQNIVEYIMELREKYK